MGLRLCPPQPILLNCFIPLGNHRLGCTVQEWGRLLLFSKPQLIPASKCNLKLNKCCIWQCKPRMDDRCCSQFKWYSLQGKLLRLWFPAQLHRALWPLVVPRFKVIMAKVNLLCLCQQPNPAARLLIMLLGRSRVLGVTMDSIRKEHIGQGDSHTMTILMTAGVVRHILMLKTGRQRTFHLLRCLHILRGAPIRAQGEQLPIAARNRLLEHLQRRTISLRLSMRLLNAPLSMIC
mmetsp:Transcript_41600/g.76890  ORF Transcript_41600/g.76890 Transcript_41600/m.76890 type:complete len:234 (-) Transcript_41600:1093-1794(-)